MADSGKTQPTRKKTSSTNAAPITTKKKISKKKTIRKTTAKKKVTKKKAAKKTVSVRTRKKTQSAGTSAKKSRSTKSATVKDISAVASDAATESSQTTVKVPRQIEDVLSRLKYELDAVDATAADNTASPTSNGFPEKADIESSPTKPAIATSIPSVQTAAPVSDKASSSQTEGQVTPARTAPRRGHSRVLPKLVLLIVFLLLSLWLYRSCTAGSHFGYDFAPSTQYKHYPIENARWATTMI